MKKSMTKKKGRIEKVLRERKREYDEEIGRKSDTDEKVRKWERRREYGKKIGGK